MCFHNVMLMLKYDKIVSGYHSTIALKSDGVFAVWGSSMKSNGSTDQLAPQDIKSTNYTYTGTVLKIALGGSSASSQVDQAFLLTTRMDCGHGELKIMSLIQV